MPSQPCEGRQRRNDSDRAGGRSQTEGRRKAAGKTASSTNPDPTVICGALTWDSDTAGMYRVIQPKPVPRESYPQWFRRVIMRHRLLTWFSAFYVHWLLLLVMSLILIHAPDDTASLLLNATFATDPVPQTEAFDVVAPVPAPVPLQATDPADRQSRPLPRLETIAESSVPLNAALPGTSDTTPEADTASASAHSRLPQANATVPPPADTPQDAVTEGSFTVWTDPPQPVAGEPYRIIIQIRLPPGVQRCETTDLQGVVIGSDGYRKQIPGMAPRTLPVVDGYARLVVPIVSADAQVKDLVLIRSKMLNESQKLVLQF